MSITFTGVAGGPNPAPQSIFATTSNGAVWHSLDTSPWFNAGPISGASGTSTTLTPNITGLVANTYTENITFSASGLPNKVVVVTLILTAPGTPTPSPTPGPTATPAPTATPGPTATPSPTPGGCPPTQICVSPTSITFTAVAGGPNPAPQSIQVTTSNGAIWHSNDTSPWFNAGPTSGASGTSTTLTPNIAGLVANTYTQNITFSASGLPNKIVVVTLILTAPPTPTPSSTATPAPTATPSPTPAGCPPTQICVSPTSITFTATAGGANPAPQSIQVTTSNGATWTSNDTSPWFNAGPTSGASGTSTTLTPNISGLGANTYTENITFSASGLPNKIVVVTLILSP